MNKKNSGLYLIYAIVALCILFKLFDFIYNKVDYKSSPSYQNVQTYLTNLLCSRSYNENMMLAQNEFDIGNYEGAISFYTYALKQRQNSDEAYYNRARTKLKLNDYQGAKTDLDTAIKLNPKRTIDNQFRDSLLEAQLENAISFLKNGDTFYNYDPLDYVSEDEGHDPANMKSMFINRYEQAISELNEIIKFQPKNYEAYIYRAVAKFKNARFKEAVEDFNNSLRIKPNNPDVYYYIGNMYGDLVDYKESIIEQKRIKMLNENFSKMIYNSKQTKLPKNDKDNRDLSKIYRNEYLLALSNYNKAIALDPKFEEAYFNRGTVHWALNNYTEALSDFDKVLSLNPNDKNACINIIYVKIDLAKYYRDKNRAIYDKLSNEISNDYYSLARLYSKDTSMTKDLKELKEEIYEEIYKSDIAELFKNFK